MVTSEAEIKTFQKKILVWYRVHGRHDLPWRHTRDPYKIFVSEIMLQQTQVDRVVPKYKNFLKQFPTVKRLAYAPQAAVLKEWQGLGYNRRALYVKRAAAQVVKNYKGAFPKNPHELEKLPGVGHYTARAMCAFAWDMPEVFIETNIRRVYIHFFFAHKKKVIDAEILECIQKTLPPEHIREWYWALMDYGAGELKNISNPNRKSIRYVRQSKFEGSRRFARAKLLDLILLESRLTLKKTQALFERDPLLAMHNPKEILEALARDGFIKKNGAVWHMI